MRPVLCADASCPRRLPCFSPAYIGRIAASGNPDTIEAGHRIPGR